MTIDFSPVSSYNVRREAYSPDNILASKAFQNVDSSQFVQLYVGRKVGSREDFFGLDESLSPPPLIGKSSFIPIEMVEHLMRNKKDCALGVKYVVGDQITNMEGALHSFVTPVGAIYMTGDFKWVGHLLGKEFGSNRVRQVILSAAIHPDFELDTVIMPLVRLQKESVEGAFCDFREIPTALEKQDSNALKEYESKLLKGMIYQLSHNHRLPAISEIPASQIMSQAQTKQYLEQLISNPSQEFSLRDKYMKYGSSIISLEILFHIYVEQIQNEFKILNSEATQGFVYTLSPPSIFAQTIGGASILNRLQALAFKQVASSGLFSHLKVLGFADYADPMMVPLLQSALPSVQVMSQNQLFDSQGLYCGEKGLALVLHNNSDAFGQNIETEGATSLDGVIGSFSNAASVLKRDRPDLLNFVY